MIGELLNVLKPDNAAVITGKGGKTRRSLVNVKVADRLERHTCPACLKSTGAHIIGAADHGGREQKRVFQRHTAHLRAEPVIIFRESYFQLRLYLIMKPRHQCADRHLT